MMVPDSRYLITETIYTELDQHFVQFPVLRATYKMVGYAQVYRSKEWHHRGSVLDSFIMPIH